MRTNQTQLIAVVVAMLALNSITYAQARSSGRTKQELDNRLAGEVDKLFLKWNKPGSPGYVLAIIKDGKVIYKRSYGLDNLEYDIPLGSSSVFYVGSIAKQFTATCIALLAQQGKLSLDDNIRKFLPEIPDYGAPITIRHLIHHTSGLRDFWDLIGQAG